MYFCFGFEEILNNQLAPVATGIKVLGVHHHLFRFVYLILTLFLITLFIIIEINMILIDLRVVMTS